MSSQAPSPEVPIIHAVQDIPETTDLVVVLGKNIGQDWDAERVLHSPHLLSTDSMINTLAAGQVWVPGRTILFSGGQKLGPELPYQAEAAKQYFSKKFPHIPDEDVRTETTGYSTPKSAEAVQKIISSENFGHVALLSVGYHLEYAPISFAQFDVPIESAIASEDILAERSKYFSEFVVAWHARDRIIREKEYATRKREEVMTTDIRGAASDARTRQRVFNATNPSA